jgi:hypothetical protein
MPDLVARLARELVARCREITARVNELEIEIQLLVAPLSPALLAASRLWCAVSGEDHRRNGRNPTLSFEGCLREAQRDRATAGLVGKLRSPPSEPDGQPAAQCRTASHRPHPGQAQLNRSRPCRPPPAAVTQGRCTVSNGFSRTSSSARCRPRLAGINSSIPCRLT